MTSEAIIFKLPLDHVVISVSNLKKSVEQFKSYGFQVEYGGQNGPTHNALIFFKDGKYIELISLRSKFIKILLKARLLIRSLGSNNSKAIELSDRFLTWFSEEPSLCDWCLRCEDMDESAAALQKQGHSMTDIEQFKRVRPDGKIAEWLLSGTETRSLPFLIQDISSPDIRVPYVNNCNHDNGVIGISALRVNQQYSDVADEQLKSFCNILSNNSSLSTNIHVENRPHKPHLLLELKTNSIDMKQMSDEIKLNENISIIK